jgi:hypothetical protein
MSGECADDGGDVAFVVEVVEAEAGAVARRGGAYATFTELCGDLVGVVGAEHGDVRGGAVGGWA